jgi:predicted RNA-binding protein (virulence factor B family)
MAEIGKSNTLTVLRDAVQGLYLDGAEHGEILMPRRYVPPRAQRGDRLKVFVHRDSEDRLVATTETPRATVGEFAALKVVSVSSYGAFLDWGLTKDLMLPFRECEGIVHPGETVVVFVHLDPKTDRIVASMRLRRHTSRETPACRAGDAVDLLIASRTPLGCNAVVNRTHLGLLFLDANAAPVEPGTQMTGYVRAVRPDGRIDLGLDRAGYQRVAPLTEQIIAALEKNGGRLSFDDDSAPEAIRARFGVSKKAFKQALGALYKARRIEFVDPGVRLLETH